MPPSNPPPDEQAPVLEHALWAASLGLRVHPLHYVQSDGLSCSCLPHDQTDPATGEPVYCAHGNRMVGKHPRLKSWPERASNEPSAVRGLFTAPASRQKSNLAVATGPGSGAFVLDVDPKNGGDESLADLLAHYGPLPDTWETLTASGGRHIWLAWPDLPDFVTIGNVNSSAGGGPLGPGLDIRGLGGYVVIPPSSRGVLGTYVWELSSVPGEVPLAPAPDWFVEFLTRPAALPFSVRAPDQAYPPADAEAVEAGCAFMRHARDDAPSLTQWEWRQALTVWGRCEGGDDLAHVRSAADPVRYTPEGTAQALRAALARSGPLRCTYAETRLAFAGCAVCPHHGRLQSPIQLGRTSPRTRAYSSREAPPPGVGEVPAAVPRPPPSDARAGAAPSPGQNAPSGGGSEPPPPPPDEGAPHPAEDAPQAAQAAQEGPGAGGRKPDRRPKKGRTPVVMTAEELLAKVFPVPRDVLPQMVPEGLSLLVGRSKLGKSILMVQGAIAIATGGYLFGKDVQLPVGRVLYLDLENGERRVQQRVRAMLGDGGEARLEGRLHISPEWPDWQNGGIEYLRVWLETHPDTRLIVVDTLKRVRPSEGAGNKRLYDLDYDALSPLADLAHRYSVAIVVVHHTRKADASDILDSASGSTGLVAAVDSVLIWRRARGRSEAKLYLSDRDRGEIQHAFIWSAQLGGWSWSGTISTEAEETSGGGVGEGDVGAQVLAILEQTGVPLSPAELAAELHKSPGAMRVQLFRMVRAGTVEHLDIRATETGAERGSFYAPPKAAAHGGSGQKAAAYETGNPGNARNGVTPPLFDPLYQEGEGPSEPVTPALHAPLRLEPRNAPQVTPPNGPLPDREEPQNAGRYAVTAVSEGASGTTTAGYLGSGARNRRQGEEAVLALAEWRQWGGFTTPRGGFGFPPLDTDREPTPEEREAAWRRDVAQASDSGLATVWLSLWSRNPPAVLRQWAPPVTGGAS